MDWHVGDISSAIRSVKESSKLLLIFVTGVDDISKEMEVHFDTDICQHCTDLVCVRLEAASKEAAQFSAVYALLTVPCVYLIAPSGNVVAMRVGMVDKPELSSWIQTNLSQFNMSAHEDATASGSHPSTSTNQSTSPASGSSSMNAPQVLQPGADGGQQAKLEDRVQHAYNLVEAKRQERQALDNNKAISGETDRRKMGKSMQEFKEQQKARELLEARAERRQSELEARELRARLLREIADDRQAQQERDRLMMGQSSVTAVRPAPVSTAASMGVPADGQVHLQVRLPNNGSSHLLTRLPTAATLAGELRTWIEEQADTGNELTPEVRSSLAGLVRGGYSFRQLYPTRFFKPEEETQSFAELGLHPSAILLLVPSGRSGQLGRVSSPGLLSYIFATVKNTSYSVFSVASRLFFGVLSIGGSIVSSVLPSSSGGGGGSSSPPQTSQGQSVNNRSGGEPKTAAGSRDVGAARRRGNMARLSHQPDTSDDEQARWNGNSTQQL